MESETGRRHAAALAAAHTEASLIWNRFQAYLIGHTILMTICATTSDLSKTIAYCVGGIVLTVLWGYMNQRGFDLQDCYRQVAAECDEELHTKLNPQQLGSGLRIRWLSLATIVAFGLGYCVALATAIIAMGKGHQ